MAKLMKRGKTWHVRLQYHGRDLWRSTGETVKGKAEDKAAGIIAEVKGTVSLAGLFEKVLDQIIRIEDDAIRDRTRREFARQLLQGTTSKLLVSDAWSTWLSNPRKGRRGDPKENTVAGYKAIWTRFAGDPEEPKKPGWLSRVHPGVKYLHEVTETMTEDYATDLWGSHMSPATYNAHVKFLKSMFKTLATKAGISLNPWPDGGTIETETQGKQPLTEKELAKVCTAAKGDLRYWLAIGIYTGLRLGDVVTLRWEEINLHKGLISRIPLKVSRQGERKKIECPIHPVLVAMFKELRQHADKEAVYLFPEAVKAYRRDRASITRQIQELFTTCGIATTEESENGHRRRVIVRKGFHSLRHSFVSLCAANHVPQVAIMDLVGHGSPAMTELYMHADMKQRTKAIAQLPPALFSNGKHKRKARV